MLGALVSFNVTLASIRRVRHSECLSQLLRLFEPFLNGDLDRAVSAVKTDEAVVGEAGNHMKMNVEDVLPAVPAVVLANRNAISRAHGLYRGGDAHECRHQRPREVTIDLLNLRHVPDGHYEHVAAVARPLMPAREHRGLGVAKRHDARSELTPDDATEHARSSLVFHGPRLLRGRQSAGGRRERVWLSPQ